MPGCSLPIRTIGFKGCAENLPDYRWRSAKR